VPLLSKLRRGELMMLVEAVTLRSYSAGQRVCKQGDPQKTFFIVESGKVGARAGAGTAGSQPYSALAVLRVGCAARWLRSRSVPVVQVRTVPSGPEFEDGMHFGEMALLQGHRVEKDMNAVTHSTLLCLDNAVFESILGPYMKLIEAHYNTAILAQVPSLSKLTPVELRRLCDCLQPERYQPKALLHRKGEALNKLVILVSGSCTIEGPGVAGKDTRDPYAAMEEPWDPDRKLLQAGDFFGQMALLSEEVSEYSVTAGPESVDAVVLHRKDATALFGPLHRLIIQREEVRGARKDEDDAPTEAKQHWTVRDQPDVLFEDLRAVALLRSGTFSDVRMVVHKPLGTVFALKSYSRAQMKKFSAEQLPMRDKTSLTVVGSHPFIAGLVNTYKNAKKLYMLQELVPGGELYHRIHPPNLIGSAAGPGGSTKLPEDHAQFYAASVCIALGYMHSREVQQPVAPLPCRCTPP